MKHRTWDTSVAFWSSVNEEVYDSYIHILQLVLVCKSTLQCQTILIKSFEMRFGTEICDFEMDDIWKKRAENKTTVISVYGHLTQHNSKAMV